MNALDRYPFYGETRSLIGLPVCDLGWTAALGLVEELASLRGMRTTLSFLDERSTFFQLFDTAYRAELGRRLLLPSGGRLFGRLAGSSSTRFSPTAFVPALLTFLEGNRRICLMGEDAGRLGDLKEQWVRHAPWHEFSSIPTDIANRQVGASAFDLVIVDACGPAAERRVERHLASVDTGLVIMTGGRLEARVDDRSAITPQPATSLRVNTLFATKI